MGVGGPKGTGTATPRTSPGVRSDQNFEANPAVATRGLQEAQEGQNGGGVAVSVPFPPWRSRIEVRG